MINGFTVINWKHILFRHPIEDSYKIHQERKIIAVADGVTRDPMLKLPNRNTFFGELKFSLKYPRPSPAKIVADIFTTTFINFLKDYKKITPRLIRKAFEKSNEKIRLWNNKHMPKPDYLINDFASCVAAGAAIENQKVIYGYICDAGVAIFDKQGKLKLKTKEENKGPSSKILEKEFFIKNGDDYIVRKIGRSIFRNNPKRKNSIGVLTGEKKAMRYVRTKTYKLQKGDILILYTDGIAEIIFKNEKIRPFFSELIKNKDWKKLRKIFCKKIRTEGTIVYYVNE
ncbi:MAG: hypothetical protein KatS3mg001_183 [Candidatus Pacearchaeota archaeon]|nr:MAG: hypothetical protein KatS3mg001_183 [Candidatus Pacearchaeota archaeon]